ncbi:MAG TPA: hypothetical protein VK090_00180 [Paracoccaceae bacterium]|nr:hypothetical protein [Paracoccaceae bacterium]
MIFILVEDMIRERVQADDCARPLKLEYAVDCLFQRILPSKAGGDLHRVDVRISASPELALGGPALPGLLAKWRDYGSR